MAVDTTGVGTQAVERAMSLLVCFSDEHSELRISELCSKTGLGQSTVSRMIGTLDRLRFVEHDHRTGLYRLGATTVRLGSVALNSSPVFRSGRQLVQNLAQTTGLGANLAEFNNNEMFYVCNFEGAQSPKSFTMAGRSAPLHATGLGKAILSGQSRDYVRDYFKGGVVAYTPHTIVRLDDMTEALEEVRNRGYATEIEELAFGRSCISAPIRERTGDVVAALSVSGALSVIDVPNRQQELGLKVIEVADEISVALGYSPIRAPISVGS